MQIWRSGWCKRGESVFVDAKLFDIDRTVEAAARSVAGMGAQFLTVHGNGSCVEAAVRGAVGSQMKVLAVTVLTSEEAQEDDVVECARRAHDARADGVIASAREAEAIRKELGDDFLIVCPGIRLSRGRGA